MEYFKIKDENGKDIFINLENVLWIEFEDAQFFITFFKGKQDSVQVTIKKENYQEAKVQLIRVLTSSTCVVLD